MMHDSDGHIRAAEVVVEIRDQSLAFSSRCTGTPGRPYQVCGHAGRDGDGANDGEPAPVTRGVSMCSAHLKCGPI